MMGSPRMESWRSDMDGRYYQKAVTHKSRVIESYMFRYGWCRNKHNLGEADGVTGVRNVGDCR